MVHVRITGRTLRPGDPETRRLFLGTLGVELIKVPRSQNPYAVARRIRRYLRQDDIVFLKALASSKRAHESPLAPDPGAAELLAGEDYGAAAE